MIAYLDSSVLLRVLLNQSGKLKEFKSIEKAVASVLLKTECLRVLDRLRITGVLTEKNYLTAVKELYEACAAVETIKITTTLLNRAGTSMPVVLGTLDAIHLMSALIWTEKTEEPLSFLTHDNQLGKAATALGFRVFGI
jgi:predicted nucleic acid-binding protein